MWQSLTQETLHRQQKTLASKTGSEPKCQNPKYTKMQAFGTHSPGLKVIENLWVALKHNLCAKPDQDKKNRIKKIIQLAPKSVYKL